jgi:2-polyprenyl-6-hydroxyphenyl methylase/3-demethylubiquinone-9 3-methyltransferase
MWKGIELSATRVRKGGQFFIAIYNDQGWKSRMWWHIKRLYNWLPNPVRPAYVVAVILPFEVRRATIAFLTGKLREYLATWTNYEVSRGMSRWHDMVDWVGGFPFETATIDEIQAFLRTRGFVATKVLASASVGCNQFVFSKD